ncbi:histidinol-phosphate transaminase [uncultured Maribacter sp.]|uniref:histidinol-phosphate transaminase n=1 Tax=uncultured Maribacter sp. TaxID=431308 RepID=UPI0026033D61|nr:histidinol-phosphate transaminase [uncultured Maribacter sp.]
MSNFNLDSLVRPNIRKLKAYSSARGEFQGNGEKMMLLDANESPFENGLNRYPDPQHRKLRARVSEIKDVPVENILLGNGSDELINLFFNAFCQPREDNVIVLPPTFGMYEVQANISDIELQKIELSEDFQPNIDRILEASNANTKMLFICSPNNPTGNSIDTDKIEQLLNQFKGLVVIDEAYIDFSSKPSWTKRLNDFPNLIIIQTLSKAYGLAGIRLGMCYASKEIIEILNRLKLPYNINSLTQRKALSKLENLPLIQEKIERLLEGREFVVSQLQKIDCITTIYPSDANFVLAKFDDADKRYKELIAKGIVVRNRSTQHGCSSTLRLTIGTREENIVLIKALKDLV